MDRFNSPLDHVKIAAPCKADWEQMIGSERVRFCGQCNLNVFNLSSMTKAEAESLVTQTEGRLCVRFYRRKDGSILTDNCPVGLRAIRKRLSSLAKAVSAAVLSFFAGLGIYRIVSASLHTSVMGAIPVSRSSLRTPLMGDVAAPVGQIEVNWPQPEEGKVILQNPAGRKATRRIDRSRTAPTR
jgi:hypothetical protein